MLTIDGVDDVEEMRLTDDAFDILGFTQVCLDSLKRSTRSFRRSRTGREDQSVQMHGIDHALR